MSLKSFLGFLDCGVELLLQFRRQQLLDVLHGEGDRVDDRERHRRLEFVVSIRDFGRSNLDGKVTPSPFNRSNGNPVYGFPSTVTWAGNCTDAFGPAFDVEGALPDSRVFRPADNLPSR